MLKNNKIKIGILLIIAFSMMFTWIRCSRGRVEVAFAEVERGNISNTLSASGLVEANSADLGSGRVAGRVGWVGVEEGARVKAGQILLTFDGYDQAKKEYERSEKLQAQGFISERELERAKNELDASCIITPIAGTVTRKTVIAGETVSPGVPIITVVETQSPWVEIQIDEVDVAKAQLGQRVRFSTDAFPDREFFGKIYWINKTAELKHVGGRVRMDEEDLVFRAKVALEDGAVELKPGMSVYAEIIIGEKRDVLVLPREAVTLRDGKGVAYIIKGSRVKLAEIEIGLRDAEKVEIVKGLVAGDKVAASSLDKLKDGARVKSFKEKK